MLMFPFLTNRNRADCGVFAIAFVVAIWNDTGENQPSKSQRCVVNSLTAWRTNK